MLPKAEESRFFGSACLSLLSVNTGIIPLFGCLVGGLRCCGCYGRELCPDQLFIPNIRYRTRQALFYIVGEIPKTYRAMVDGENYECSKRNV